MQFREHTLSNGLQVVAEVDDAALSCSFGFFVDAGARHERDGESGLSHFLEHMLFKGTPRRTAAQVNREIDALGGNCNAYTAEDHTVYYMHVIPRLQRDAVDLLSDLMRASLREDDFETERKVILEEIAMYDDQPPYGAAELSMEQYFGSHPLSNRVLGTTESIRDMTPSAMRAYHRRRYAPGRISVVAAGAVDFDALIRQIETTCGSWEATDENEPAQPPLVLSPEVYREAAVPIANQQYLIGLQAAPPIDSEERWAWRLAVSAVGDERGSRLFWALLDPGLAESAGMSIQHFSDCGILHSFIACAPEDAAENWSLLRETVESVRERPLERRELELVRNRACASLILAAERPSNRLFSVGNAWFYRRRYDPLPEVMARYEAVTLDQINAAADAVAAARGTLTAVGPRPLSLPHHAASA